MFITCERSGLNDAGEQVAHGLFLILLSGERNKETGEYPLRAVVRHVRMRQCGHWMMGSAAVGSDRVTLSGTYGNDGLPVDGERYPAAWARSVEVPADVARVYWAGEGGHNSAGSEGPAMHAWAKANLATLRGLCAAPGCEREVPGNLSLVCKGHR